MAEAQKLAACLRARGVTVSIELQKGATGGLWDRSVKKVGVMSHHTVSRRSQGLTPCLALVKRGRSDVPGPLCNGYGGYDLVYRIITMDIANHSGAGGPLNVPGFRIPLNQGRYYIWGTEYEGGLDANDWTPEFRTFMARSNAAILEYLGLPNAAHMEHKTWAGNRKIDRLGYTTESGRAEIFNLGGGSSQIQPDTTPGVGAGSGAVAGNPWAGSDPNAKHANGSRVLRLYSSGTDVRFFQALVGLKDDGEYGLASVNRAKAWQKENGLTPDGIIGARSWAKLLLNEDGIRGVATITRLQRVMGTHPDGVISKPSSMWVTVQEYLNSVVDSAHIRNLTGKPRLEPDGYAGKNTFKVLQFLLFNWYAPAKLGRGPVQSDFDGIDGENTWKLFQYALNHAVIGSGKF